VPLQEVNAIAIDPATPQNVYLAAPDGLFRSKDGGLTWEALPVQLNSEPLALTLDPRNPIRLFALLADGTLMQSEDSGTSWAGKEVGP
jgi:photosystem II stability/assembly factor-like uncharacterized protein